MRSILEKVRSRQLSIDEAEKLIKLYQFEEVTRYVLYDIGRYVRRGVPEIVFAEPKAPEIVKEIVLNLVKRGEPKVIISRVKPEHIKVLKSIDFSSLGYILEVREEARIIVVKRKDLEQEQHGGRVAVVAAGTADIPIAEEVKVIAEEMGCTVLTVYDVGIANMCRALYAIRKILEFDPDIVVVVAGMEGALPSVIASFLDVPVIAVPRSVGYGLGGKGLAAILSMLQSCTLGVAVVNIDNGVGAGVIASMVARRVSKFRKSSS
ncbi:MAG: nickel pincer cofactor biosynthesis protein LarB [Thermoprotei archaeon]|nr:MAG: nickel pincer cofactor biosynthesis protein LarB [Thermoprotei archaeon]